MFKVLYDLLKDHNPYPPGKHTGLCESNYLVIKEGMTSPDFGGNKTGASDIDIILFVPIDSYVAMKDYRDAVVATLKGHLRKTGVETPIIPDNDKKAYTMSIGYKFLKRLEE